jgi:hypothetical protein
MLTKKLKTTSIPEIYITPNITFNMTPNLDDRITTCYGIEAKAQVNFKASGSWIFSRNAGQWVLSNDRQQTCRKVLSQEIILKGTSCYPYG